MRRAPFAWPLLLLVAVAAGCARDEQFAHFDQGSRSTAIAVHAKAKGPKDRFLRVAGTKKNKAGQLAITLERDLWPSLRVEVVGGLLDPKKAAAADQAIFGLELDVRGPFPPTQFFGISSQVTNGGMNVFAFSHLSGTPIASQFLAGVTEVRLAVAYDGANFTFQAKDRDAPAFTTIANLPFVGLVQPLIPDLGVFNLLNQGAIGFDEFRVVQNGNAPAPTAGQSAADLIWQATDPVLEALYLVDAVPDWTAALAQCDAALVGLTTAQVAVAALPQSKTRTQVQDKLNSATTSLTSARNLIMKQNKAKKVIKRLKTCLKTCGQGAYKVYDLPP